MALANSARSVGSRLLAESGYKGSIDASSKVRNTASSGSSGSFSASNTFGGGRSGGGSGRTGREASQQWNLDQKAFEESLPWSYGFEGFDKDMLPKFISNTASEVKDAFGDVLGFVKDQIGDATLADRIESMIHNALNPVEFFDKGLDKITEFITGQNNSLGSLFDSASKSFSSGFGSLASAINDSANVQAKSNEDVMKLIQDTADANNAWSARQAQINRDWQERMSNTAHQREVADLQAAGLNPVLSSSGSGASVGSGAVAQADNSNTRLIAEVAMQAVEMASLTAQSLGSVAKSNTDNSLLGKIISFGNTDVGKKIVGTAVPYVTRWALKKMLPV